MQSIHNYDIYIFDCDGVILDSNALKVNSMKKTLEIFSFDDEEVFSCVEYFSNNFGKSRFHHVEFFVNEILTLQPHQNKQDVFEKIILEFSTMCRDLYGRAKITPNFIEFIESLDGAKFIASGSAENELREVFLERNLDKYFDKIYGSPKKKTDIVHSILKSGYSSAVMFGDALSDLQAAIDNNIDFVAYTPYSNVKERLVTETIRFNYPCIEDWREIK